ncbi:restriction endonuclease subunit S [Psychromonas sp. MME2]|uniref:restriction endonuclease subunit S n=1 Tax=unclassified Psychromonas TaxID=2614957 RepID=UPI00339D2E65
MSLVDSRVSIKGVSEVSSIDFVVNKNKCNLNIPRYIDIFGDEAKEDLNLLGKQQSELESKLEKLNIELNVVCRELGIDNLSDAGTLKELFKGAVYFKGKNGERFPEWRNVKIVDMFDFITTNSFSRALLNHTNGSVRNIHYGDIHTKLPSHIDLKQVSLPFINPDVDIKKIVGVNYCKDGDLIIADASEDYKDIGKAIELVNIEDSVVLAGLHTFLLRPKEKCAIGYLGYCLQNYYVRKQMMRLATGVSVLGLSKTSLCEVEIPIPCFEEQEKIVTFLNLLDKKTKLTDSVVKNSQQLQKGLLQQMFV